MLFYDIKLQMELPTYVVVKAFLETKIPTQSFDH